MSKLVKKKSVKTLNDSTSKKSSIKKSKKNNNDSDKDSDSDSEINTKKYKISPNGDIIDSSESEDSVSEEELSGKEEIDEDIDSDDEYKDKNVKKKIEDGDDEEDEPEDDEIIILDDDEDTTAAVIYNKIVPDDQRKTTDYLTRFECGRVIGDYSRALANGATPYIDITNMTNEYEIAYNSLLQRKIPFQILRKIGKNEFEKWKLSEMQITDLPPISVFMS